MNIFNRNHYTRVIFVVMRVFLAPLSGFEPETPRLGGGRSIQLSYKGMLYIIPFITVNSSYYLFNWVLIIQFTKYIITQLTYTYFFAYLS